MLSSSNCGFVCIAIVIADVNSRILTFVEAVAAAAVVAATTLAVGYSRSSSLSWTNEDQHHSLKSIAYPFGLPAVFWL